MKNTLRKRYNLLKVIGQGGMGRVYLAQDIIEDRQVAIKQMMLRGGNNDQSIARFQREHYFLSQIDHPNIIKSYDFFEEKSSLFLVMEYVPGILLKDFISHQLQLLSLQDKISITLQITRSVGILNRIGIIHRDIKPANIMMDEINKLAKLLDLGIAKSFKEELTLLTQAGSTVGTPHYMSPEQVDGEVSVKSDAFSLGIIYYQIFSGQEKSPFDKENPISSMNAVCSIKLPSLITTISGIADGERRIYGVLSTLINALLEKKVEDRISVMDAEEKLKEVLNRVNKKEQKTLQNANLTETNHWQDTVIISSRDVRRLKDLVGEQRTKSQKIKKTRHRTLAKKKNNSKNKSVSIKYGALSFGIFCLSVVILFITWQKDTKNDLKTPEAKQNREIVTFKLLDFVKQLANPNTRKSAINALGKMGPNAQMAIPDLIKYLADPELDIRILVKDNLQKINPKWDSSKIATKAIPDLIKSLVGKRIEVQRSAANTLKRIDPDWNKHPKVRDMIPFLIPAIANPNKQIRESAKKVLQKIDRNWHQYSTAKTTIPRLIELLGEKNQEAHLLAKDTLQKIDPNWHKLEAAKKAIPHLIQHINNLESLKVLDNIDPEWHQLETAKEAIPHLIKILPDDHKTSTILKKITPLWSKTEAAKAVIPEVVEKLIESLASANDNKKFYTMVTLSDFGPLAKVAVPKMIPFLIDPSPKIRNITLACLRSVDSDWPKSTVLKTIVPNLARDLNSLDSEIYESTIYILYAVGSEAKIATPEFIKIINQPEEHKHNLAIQILGQIGPLAKAAIPDLVKYLISSASSSNRNGATSALDKIDSNWVKSDEARATVLKLDNNRANEDRGGRQLIIKLLGKIKLPQESVLSKIIPYMADSDSTVRFSARKALREINQSWHTSDAARKTVPQLIQSLYSNNVDVCESVLQTLAKIGPPAKAAIPDIIKCFRSKLSLHYHALNALKRIDVNWRKSKTIKTVIPDLIANINHKDEKIRRSAIGGLGEIGSAAKAAVPDIIKVLASPENFSHGRIPDVLRKIDPLWYKTTAGKKAITNLCNNLKDANGDKRTSILRDLARIGLPAKEATLNLIFHLKSHNNLENSHLVSVLDKVNINWHRSNAVRAALPKFIKNLESSNVMLLQSTLDTLEEIGPPVRKTIPAITKNLHSNHPVYFESIITIKKISPNWDKSSAIKTIIPALIAKINHTNDKISYSAINALGEMGPLAKAAIPKIIEALTYLQSAEEIERLIKKDPLKIFEIKNGAPYFQAVEALQKIDLYWYKSAAAKKAITYLSKGLINANKHKSKNIIKALGQIGPPAKEAIPNLITYLTNSNSSLRLLASRSLQTIDNKWYKSSAAKKVIPELGKQLADSDDNTFFVEILGQMGPQAKPVIPQMIPHLTSSNSRLRSDTVKALKRIDPYWYDSATEVIPDLIKDLNDPNFAIRKATINVLSQMGPQAKKAIPNLIQCFYSEYPLYKEVALTLKKIDWNWYKSKANKKVIRRLVKQINHSDKKVRYSAIEALGEIGSAAKIAIPSMIKALTFDDHDHYTPTEALQKIDFKWHQSKATQKAIPKIVKNLTDNDIDVCRSAMRTLGAIGPQAQIAVPDLIKCFTFVRPLSEAIRALEKIDPNWATHSEIKSTIPHLTKLITNDILNSAIRILKEIGPQAKPAIPALVEYFRDNDFLRYDILEAINKIDPSWKQSTTIKKVIPDLIKHLKSSNSDIKFSAVLVLEHIGPDAKAAIPHIADVFTSPDFSKHDYVVKALAKINPDWYKSATGQKIITKLIKHVSDPNRHARRSAMEALGEIALYYKKATPDLISCLIKRLDDPNRYLHSYALVTLGKIGSEASSAVPHLVKYHDRLDSSKRFEVIDILDKIAPNWRENFAIAYYTDRIKNNPLQAYNNRGLIYCHLKKYQQALADYNKVIKLDPQNQEVYNNLGLLYYHQEKYQQALAEYNKALELDPQNAQIYSNRGLVYYKLGKYQQALADYDESTGLNYKLLWVYGNRGLIYYRLKKYQEALTDYKLAIYRGYKGLEIYDKLGNLYYLQGKYQKAIENWETAVSLGMPKQKLQSRIDKAKKKLPK